MHVKRCVNVRTAWKVLTSCTASKFFLSYHSMGETSIGVVRTAWTGTRAARGRCWRESWHVYSPAFKYLRVFLCISFSCVVLFLASRERARSRLTGLPRRGRTFHQQTMQLTRNRPVLRLFLLWLKFALAQPAFHRHQHSTAIWLFVASDLLAVIPVRTLLMTRRVQRCRDDISSLYRRVAFCQ